MGLRSSPLAYTILPSSAGGLGLFQSKADGLINGSVIGLNRNIKSNTKRNCILAEELGHYYTTVGSIIDQTDSGNRKQELRARIWAYNKLIGLMGIIDSFKNHCHSLAESAEYLDVTEDFLSDAISYYKSKYGISVTVDNYVIYFEPSLGVFELV